MTRAISITWKNKIFHHRTHLCKTLFAFKIWSDLSTLHKCIVFMNCHWLFHFNSFPFIANLDFAIHCDTLICNLRTTLLQFCYASTAKLIMNHFVPISCHLFPFRPPNLSPFHPIWEAFSIFSYLLSRKMEYYVDTSHLLLQERCKSYQNKNYTLYQVKEILTSAQKYSVNLIHQKVLLSLCIYQSHMYIHLNYLLIPITLV